MVRTSVGVGKRKPRTAFLFNFFLRITIMLEKLYKELNIRGDRVRLTLHSRIAIKMPNANQEMSLYIINRLLKLTEKTKDYCFLCFDPDHVEAGEIGLELRPGCNWYEVFDLLD
jgi:hypothetical protein